MGVRKQKYAAPRRRFPVNAYVILTAVQERSLGCARDDDTGNGYSQRFESRDEQLVTGRWGAFFLVPHSSRAFIHNPEVARPTA